MRTGPDEFYVLEDNCRTPSGVSYMLENREAMMRLLPDLFAAAPHRPGLALSRGAAGTLRSVAPADCRRRPAVVLLTPGAFNSAYYEHSFLADEMGIELVEGADLFVEDNIVYMRTTEGPQRVDVIYRRIDDDFLDPLTFRPDSLLGVPGLMRAYRAGNVTLANAPGTGIADDKAIYPYVPEMIRFYPRRGAAARRTCRPGAAPRPTICAYVLDHLAELVVKESRGSGGYGMLVGPHAVQPRSRPSASKLAAQPADYIAQPTLALSTCPTFVEAGIAPRHVDLRPFVLTGATRSASCRAA